MGVTGGDAGRARGADGRAGENTAGDNAAGAGAGSGGARTDGSSAGGIPGVGISGGGIVGDGMPGGGIPDDRIVADGFPDDRIPADRFRADRAARRNVLVEDYVELIADLLAEGREVLQVDLAMKLGVAQPTVAKMLSRLASDGLVVRKAYRGVALSDEGRRLAAEVKGRHRVVEDFLRALGVGAENVMIDAEGIEHYVGDETLEAFRRALDGGLAAFMAGLGAARGPAA